MIDVSNWQAFQINELFDVYGSKTTKLEDLEYIGEGKFPYVTTQTTNNAVANFYDFFTEDGKCLVIDSAVIGNCSYQKGKFSASDHEEILRPKFDMTENIALFLTTIINQECYKYSYGRKRSQIKIKKEVIKLPKDLNGKPNWKFMEEYIEKIKNSKINNKISIRESIIMKNKNLKKNFKFNTQNWKKFKLKELFDKIYKAKSHVKSELSYSDFFRKGLIPFITRTENNNGNDCYISREEVVEIEAGNAIIIGDTTSTIFYQKDSFATGDHIIVCRAKWINEYTALFFKTVLEKERYKYSYGRAFKMELVKNTVIKLPIDKNGKLDINFMESYIKSLPYGDKLERII